MGKQHRLSFNKSSHRKDHRLDLIKVGAFPIKTKNQVANIFKELQMLVERESGLPLKSIRTDNGGKYIGEFNQYCRQHGIRHEQSVPKTPQHNGIAERMNKTIIEKVRCMLSHANLPRNFWGEAMCAAIHVINLSPTTVLEGKVPDEVWTGRVRSYNHLRVFGCKAFVHIPKDERSKLDYKSRTCIFLNYGNERFGYKLYGPSTKWVIRSRDVVFVEDRKIKDVSKINSDKASDDLFDFNSEDEEEVDQPVHEINAQGHEEPPHNAEMDYGQNDDLQDPLPHDQTQQVTPPAPPAIRTSTRQKTASSRYSPHEYILISDGGKPICYQEALQSKEKEHWKQAMEDGSLYKNHTFTLVNKVPNSTVLKNRWIYKIKSISGSVKPRYKARLVVKGYEQKHGIDYDEVFSPVVKMTSIRLALSLLAKLDLEVEQLDVKTAFLHGKEQMVCKLQKSLYGLKQAPRQWYKRFDSFMQHHGFRRTSMDHCVYVKGDTIADSIVLLLYVDDMLIMGKSLDEIKDLKAKLKHILGMKIKRDRSNKLLWLLQEKYVLKVLQRFNMDSSKEVNCPLGTHFKMSTELSPHSKEEQLAMQKIPYASAIGSLMYAMICTRPDIAYAVGLTSRFTSNPGKKHWEGLQWILRYLKGTLKMCICYGSTAEELLAYTDLDLAGDVTTMRSTSGYLVTYAGGAISWQSKQQKCVALSTTEAEYIAVTECSKEVLWLKRFTKELGVVQKRYTVQCDSQSVIHLCKNPSLHSRSKHIKETRLEL
ncbi:transmembrane signal receptor [Lithospermum erythrorhizon]|uniref:Transmembrane signal receptor n=1 Tax=Lithospermum erythrorhizon TaxID=34254 RepID=A0AAV3PUF0_LITER